MVKHISILFCALFCVKISFAAVTPAYYNSADGKSGAYLVTELNTISSTGYVAIDYGSGQCTDCVWGAFGTTDLYPTDPSHPDYVAEKAGKIWDMYSNCDFTFQTDQGSSSSSECTGGYNREHSLPKSWFGGGTAKGPGTDLFHIYPTDVHVNGVRNFYPYGEIESPTITFNNGGKYGQCSFPSGYTGLAYEPIDQYKGDFARGYMYMLLKWCAQGTSFTQDTGDNGAVIFNNTFTSAGNYGLTSYGVALLMKWHRQDPVSQKEIDRNNAVQQIQGNRNPFIDYPYLAEYLWGQKKDETFYLTNVIGSFDSQFIPGVSDGSRVATPVLLFPDADIDFGQTTSKVPVNYDVYIKGQDLTSGTVSLAITGTDAALFSLTESTLTKTEVEDGYYVVVTYAPTGDGDHTVTLTISGCGITNHQIQLTGSCLDPKATVTFYDKGKTYSVITDMVGESIVLDPPTPCDDYTFAGWSTNTYDVTNTDLPDLNYTGVIPETNTDYYAVYTRSVTKTIQTNDYKKITALEDLASDAYLVVAENSGLSAMSSEWKETYYLAPVTVVATNDFITTTESSIIWNLELDAENEVLTFYQNDKGFLYIEQRIDGNKTYHNLKLGDNTTANKFSYSLNSDGAWIFTSATYTDQQIEYYKNKARWTYYTSQDAPIYLYKHHNAATVTTFYTTSPKCTATSIDTTELDLPAQNSRKVLINGQIYILREGNIYSITGQKIY